MTTEVLDSHIADWCEVLLGVVPEDKLNASYVAAQRNVARRPGPVNGDDLLREYYKIAAKETNPTSGCKFCDSHKFDPTEFPPCPFHSKGLQL